jgi:hypothetical protein
MAYISGRELDYPLLFDHQHTNLHLFADAQHLAVLVIQYRDPATWTIWIQKWSIVFSRPFRVDFEPKFVFEAFVFSVGWIQKHEDSSALLFDRCRDCHVQQSYSNKIEFIWIIEIVTGTQLVTLKWSPESNVALNGVSTVITRKSFGIKNSP